MLPLKRESIKKHFGKPKAIYQNFSDGRLTAKGVRIDK
jgi:hypothetical protein